MDEMPIGRYGTIHYMSSNGSDVPLASYPIDEDEVVIGRSDHTTCHIRLIDHRVSDVHCTLRFKEGKAFLIVLGQNGVVVDGSDFSPSESASSPTTVPLTNGSEWLIFRRRFIFQYPPKEQRAKLLATPARKSRKSLRMSMIDSAQLWTPSAPKPKTQEESLAFLRTPVKPLGAEEDIRVTLVEGDPIHVAHSEDEVLVVETVDPPQTPILPSPSPQKMTQTPRKHGSQNLHRQVLLMNSHRKATSINEEEEREVEASVMIEEDSDEEEEEGEPNPFITKEDLSSSRQDTDKSLGSISAGRSMTGKSFRESLGAIGSILPFGRPSGAVVHSPDQRTKEQVDPIAETESTLDGPQTPSNRRILGSFLTPQVAKGDHKPPPRQSMGGTSVQYMDINSDLEQARRRLAELGPVTRPQRVQLPTEEEKPEQPKSRPEPRSTKKSRYSLADIPELSSPMPGTSAKFSLGSMAHISESDPAEVKDAMIEEDDDSAFRLQKLMRTVESVNRRESIRESRRSLVDPVSFYTARGEPKSPTKLALESTSASSPDVLTRLTEASENPPLNGHSHALPHETSDMMVDEQEEPFKLDTPGEDENDASDKVSEEAVPKKGRKHSKPPNSKKTKASRTTSKARKAAADTMDLDEPELASQTKTEPSTVDVIMEEAVEVPRRTRASKKSPAGESSATRVRRGRKGAEVETGTNSSAQDESVDAGTDGHGSSIAGEGPVLRATRTRRRPIKQEEMPISALDDAATSTSTTRRGVRSKATTVKDQDEASSTSLSEKAASARPARKPRGAARKVTEETTKPQEDIDDDLISSDLARLPQAVPEKSAKRTTNRRVKAVKTEEEKDSGASEPVPARSSRTRKTVKESPVEEAPEEIKPRRTTRTKR